MMNQILTFLILALFTFSNAGALKKCYVKYGCFSKDPPFHNPLVALPQSPSQVGTSFQLFSANDPTNMKIIDDSDVTKLQASGYDGSKDTIMVIHGWTEKVDKSEWLQSITPALLALNDKNIIIVEWEEGAAEFYTQAAGNTRLVGAQVAEMIKFINHQTGNSPASFYVIGFSLGAHVAGYAGRRIQQPAKIGRITGLDPASVFFIDTDPAVRLDPTDAAFVDVIHTSIGSLGTSTVSGHIDFYPNAGTRQRGCEIPRVGITTSVCSHVRAPKLLIESITSQCPFRAYPCAGGWNEFTRGNCQTCPSSGCPEMGFKAINSKGKASGKYYLFTNDEEPFSCGIRRIVKVSFETLGGWLSSGGKDPGMRVYGSNGKNTGIIRLGNRDIKKGSTERFIAPFKELETLTSIDVWQYQDLSIGWSLKKVLIEFTDTNEKYSACYNTRVYRIAVKRTLRKGDQSC
ncbi:inactive pancreatic lipase-related protein 1-like [Actinia tenebrosa]|uniref:Inactive pancreatic lipase-related protein 1-like n=1 Tax=Actinia tenebrosa TaxID=6105 RepID=A0A6P8HMR4_ACTTE|nr:inactive pancreatic lipase-related protein 1-like [Actinia tenebrosa]